MADFVAVIRKAVDGLANNTPETRSKVYEKARSAVVRQLENMKPRPPEELLNRQIAKLDSAIAEVESEYAEALPALEDEEDGYLPQQEAAYDEAADAEPEEQQAEEPVVVEKTAPQPVYNEPEPLAEPAPVEATATEPAYEPEQTFEAQHHYAQEPEATVEPAEELSPVAAEADDAKDHAHANWIGADSPEAQDWQPQSNDAQETAPESDVDHYAGQWTQHSADDSRLETPALDAEPSRDPFEQSYTSAQQYEQDVHVEISQPRFDAVADERKALDAAADDIFGTSDNYQPRHEPVDFTQDHPANEQDHHAATAGAVAVGTAAGAAAGSDEFKRFFDDAIDQPASTHNNTTGSLPRADADPFTTQSEGGKRDAWDDLEDLIGYDSRKTGDDTQERTLGAGDGTLRGDTTSVIPPNVYVKQKKNRTKSMLLGAAAVIVLAGGAYALYENRSALNDVVGGLTESAQTEPQTGNGTPPAGGTSDTNTGTSQSVPLPSGSNGSDNGETTGTKFTQRLQTDGTEKDEGPAPVSGTQAATAEGVSQSEKNEEAPTPAVEAPVPPAANTQQGNNNAAGSTSTPAVAVAGERMFLYEEVLGQSAPSAIAGTVAWSLGSEEDASGRPSPTVQAQLNVPERGITALMTFKKNTDASLPASHIVEIVFSTGAGFEGGAIDSVQRIAMKSTEQDRGNALIAVPAKITDDFHMIALNDFPDALKTNLELLKNRDWLDIPLAYRNGRRALLTLQKGPAGKQAFDTALKEWQAAAPAAQ